jgi:antitoxin ChpS
MTTAFLRKVGGSVMLSVPPAILTALHLEAGAEVALAVEGDKLVIEPKARPRYRLEDLLAQCKPVKKRSKDERDWLASAPVGKELL